MPTTNGTSTLQKPHWQLLHRKFSTYAALLVWGTSGFMAQPTFASFLVHFLLLPPALAFTLWLAHREGRQSK